MSFKKIHPQNAMLSSMEPSSNKETHLDTLIIIGTLVKKKNDGKNNIEITSCILHKGIFKEENNFDKQAHLHSNRKRSP